jgi:hypothetical protein
MMLGLLICPHAGSAIANIAAHNRMIFFIVNLLYC